jgi:hypothetical protein
MWFKVAVETFGQYPFFYYFYFITFIIVIMA